MAGIVYMKSNSSVSLTGAEYTGLSIPSGAKTLYVQTGSATSDRVKYGLTTDTSASVYSPLINVSGTTMYIASGGTVTETVTTGTSYHTDTRESTSATGTVFINPKTKQVVRTAVRVTTTSWGSPTIITLTKTPGYIGSSLVTIFIASSNSYSYSYSSTNYSIETTSGNLVRVTDSGWNSSYINATYTLRYPSLYEWFHAQSGNYTSQYVTKNTVSSIKSTLVNSVVNIADTYTKGTKSCEVANWKYSLKSTNNLSTQIYYLPYLASASGTDTITTKCDGIAESYLTRESTYTSRTEYLTLTSTRTTNNIAS